MAATELTSDADRGGQSRRADLYSAAARPAERLRRPGGVGTMRRLATRRSTMIRATDDSPLDGGCTCRAIRYRLQGRPLFVNCCHCTWCQRETGSAFAPTP
jgi:hypothetical protein